MHGASLAQDAPLFCGLSGSSAHGAFRGPADRVSALRTRVRYSQLQFSLEPSLQVSVDPPPPLALRLQPARDVESHQAVHDREAGAHARHRNADLSPLAAVARPADVAEDHRTDDVEAVACLRAREPERVPHTRAGPQAAHGLDTAEEPVALDREDAGRRTA